MKQGDKLKEILKRNRITQTELANHLGMAQGNLSKMLNNDILDFRLINSVAELLKVDSDKLEKQLNEGSDKGDYVARLEENLEDKMKIITLLEEQLALYKKLEKERERSSD